MLEYSYYKKINFGERIRKNVLSSMFFYEWTISNEKDEIEICSLIKYYFAFHSGIWNFMCACLCVWEGGSILDTFALRNYFENDFFFLTNRNQFLLSFI